LIALDTSSLQRYLAGVLDRYSTTVRRAIEAHDVALPPVVITEALSKTDIDPAAANTILSFHAIPIRLGYWERAGRLRASLLKVKWKAKLADTLIAQSCIDHDLPLITYDDDFRHFVRAGLQLL